MGTLTVLSSSRWKSWREVFLGSNLVAHCPGMEHMECPKPQETRRALGPCRDHSTVLKIAWLMGSQPSEALIHQGRSKLRRKCIGFTDLTDCLDYTSSMFAWRRK